MATYFVFGNAPSIDNLIEASTKGERTYLHIKMEESQFRLRHFIMNINGHKVGLQTDNEGIISAIYKVDDDHDGVKLLTMLVERWSEENSDDEEELATTVVDDELINYFVHV